MFLRRSRLRLPAILGCTLLFLVGAGDAAGLNACPRHGHAEVESTAENTAEESHQLHRTHDPHGASHPHETQHTLDRHFAQDTHDTHAHGGPAQSADADDMAHSGHSRESTGCDCIFVCLGAAQIQPFDPSPPTVVAGDPPAPATDVVFFTDATTVLPYLIPHFLPFSNAPPAMR